MEARNDDARVWLVTPYVPDGPHMCPLLMIPCVPDGSHAHLLAT